MRKQFTYWIHFIIQLLAEEAAGGLSIFDELQNSLSTQQGEMAHFARELRQVGSLFSVEVKEGPVEQVILGSVDKNFFFIRIETGLVWIMIPND